MALGLLATLATGANLSVAQNPGKQFNFTLTTLNDPKGACTLPVIPENGGNLQTTRPVPGPHDRLDHKIIWSSAAEAARE